MQPEATRDNSDFFTPTAPAEDGSPGAVEAVIFEGGGTKGMVYAGCIQHLEKQKVLENVRFFAGTSAGSQTASLLAVGYSGDELQKIMSEAPWDKLLDGSNGCCGCLAGFQRLRSKKGYYKGDFLEKYLDDLIAKKFDGQQKLTFKQFHAKTGKSLRLGVCNIATRKFEFLDHVSAPDVPISHGCRASSSIPFVFVPKVIDMGGQRGDIHFVDGGLEGNLPGTAFGPKNGLAFHLMSGTQFEKAEDAEDEPKPEPPSSFFAFTDTVVDMLWHQTNAESAEGIADLQRLKRMAKKQGGMQIIRINCGKHGVLETKMTEAQIQEMIKAGADAAEEFLKED